VWPLAALVAHDRPAVQGRDNHVLDVAGLLDQVAPDGGRAAGNVQAGLAERRLELVVRGLQVALVGPVTGDLEMIEQPAVGPSPAEAPLNLRLKRGELPPGIQRGVGQEQARSPQRGLGRRPSVGIAGRVGGSLVAKHLRLAQNHGRRRLARLTSLQPTCITARAERRQGQDQGGQERRQPLSLARLGGAGLGLDPGQLRRAQPLLDALQMGRQSRGNRPCIARARVAVGRQAVARKRDQAFVRPASPQDLQGRGQVSARRPVPNLVRATALIDRPARERLAKDRT